MRLSYWNGKIRTRTNMTRFFINKNKEYLFCQNFVNILNVDSISFL